jgi:PAS domain S-box-containing protein
MPSDSGASEAEILIPFAQPEALNHPEKLIAAYFNSTTVGFCLLDSNLRYIAINKKLAEIHGVPAPDHLGKSVRDVLGNFADTVEPHFRQVLSAGEPVNIEVSGTLPWQQETGHWRAHYLPIKNEAGEVTRIGAVVVDITAQKKLEEALQRVGGKLQQETGRLQMLSDVTSLLSSNWDLSIMFPKISARIRRVLRQEFASFALHDPGTGLLVHQATDFPLSKGVLSTIQVSAGNTPAGLSIRERAPMIFSKEQLLGFEGEVAENLAAEGLQSMCCVPLMRPKGPLGVFVLGSTRSNAFQSEDLALLNQVAAQLAIAIENHRTASEVELLKQRLGEERNYLEGETRPEGSFGELVGDSPALRQVLDQAATVASSEATVLILGETGTGKELIARAVHRMSRRAGVPLSRSTALPFPRDCWRVSSSATKKARLPEP